MSRINHSVPKLELRRVVRALSQAGLLLVCLSSCGNLVGDVEIARLPRGDDAGNDVEMQSIEPHACQRGESRCQGPVLQTCEADGSGFRSLQRCASASLCVDRTGEVSRCVEPACQAGVSCDGSALRQCAVDQTAYEVLDTCFSAAHCDPNVGACQDAPCVPGEISCNGAILRRCNGAPTGHDELATCATPALCTDLVAATCGDDRSICDVTGAVCPVPVCEVGELRCAGTRLESCNAGRNGWDFVDECVTAGVCELTRQNAVAASCVEPPCGPGDAVCSETGAILACNVDQTAYSEPLAQCRSVDFCTAGGCEADPCIPGALSCNGSTLQVCREAPGGSGISRVTVADCATQQLCQATLARGPTVPQACEPPACAAGEFRCAGRQMQVCNGGRTDFGNRELCVTDGLCLAGAGLGVCPPPCSGFVCSSSRLLGCNAELTQRADLENCGTPAECDSVQGRCADPCVPGELRCNGAALEQCENRADGWERVETCETVGLCEASVARDRTTCLPRQCVPGQHRCTGQRLEVCNAALTDFDLVTTCGAGQICDAPNHQCDVCSPNAVDCEGDRFSRCSANGQQQSQQLCGAGLCSSAGNVGCLQCPQANAFRCNNQGSLFQCSANQQLETQVGACRTPQLCRAELGQCLACDPPGSSRCNGAQVLTCSAQNTETLTTTCDTAGLCQTSGASAACGTQSCTASSRQCTSEGEVLVCNGAQTGYAPQNPRVLCATPALCRATAPGGCDTPACQPGQRQCNGQALQVCNADQTGFAVQQNCNDGSFCNGVETCNSTLLACQAGTPACPNDTLFCTGTESCVEASDTCAASGNPCGAGQVCSETVQCVQCVADSDCAPGGSCVNNVCTAGAPDGGT